MKLAAWSFLRLEACRLRLEAFFSQLSSLYNILGDDTLVFAVYNTFSSTVPTLPAAPALVALG